MSTVVNSRDVILQGLTVRQPTTTVSISSDGAAFFKPKNNSTITPSSVTLTCTVGSAYTTPTYAWYYALSSTPLTWVSTGTNSATLNVTSSAYTTLLSTTNVYILYRCVVSQSYKPTTTSNQYTVGYTREPDDGYSVIMSRQATSVLANAIGVVSVFTDTDNTIKVYKAGTAMNYGASGADTWSVSGPTISPAAMVTIGSSSGSGTTYTIGALTAMDSSTGSATATYTITIRGADGTTYVTQTAVQTYTKVKVGADSISYWVTPQAAAIGRNAAQTVLTPSTFTVNAYYATGATAPAAYPGRFKIYENGSGTASYSSGVDQSSYTYSYISAPSALTLLKVELYMTGGTVNKLDEQIIPIVQDGLVGTNGLPAYTAVLTNDACVVPCSITGVVSSFAGATTTMETYIGSTVDSTNWTYMSTYTNCSSSTANTSRIQTVNALSADVGYIDIVASKSSYSNITKRFTITKGYTGATGGTGGAGTRGTIITAATTSATSWGSGQDTEANSAINSAGGGSPIQGDLVTLYNSGSGYSESRVRSSGGTWTVITQFFGGNVLVDGTLTSAKIAAGAVTATKISVTDLSVMGSANTGNLNVTGGLTLNTTGHIKGGQTAYATGTGFYQGYSGGQYKMSIGGSGGMLTWDGSNLSIPWLTIGSVPASVVSNVLVVTGRDQSTSLSAGSDIIADSTATSGYALRVWIGWTASYDLNKYGASGRKLIDGIVIGKTYRVSARMKRTSTAINNAVIGIYDNTPPVGIIEWNPGGSLTTSWQVIQLGVVTFGWGAADQVYIYFGDSGTSTTGNNTSAFYIDWIYFQPVNAEEGATAGATWGTNITGTGLPMNYATQGINLNADPYFRGPSSLWGYNPTYVSFTTDANAPGGTCIVTAINDTPGNGIWVVDNTNILIDPNKDYEVKISVKNESGYVTSLCYLTVVFYNSSGTALTHGWTTGTNPDGSSYGYYLTNAYPIAGVMPAASSYYSTFTGSFGPHEINPIPATTKYITISILTAYSSSGNKLMKVGGVKLYEKVNASGLRVSAVATGNRIDITDGRIRVYDSSNVLRVKIGDLS
jgi:hypothetical protein